MILQVRQDSALPALHLHPFRAELALSMFVQIRPEDAQ